MTENSSIKTVFLLSKQMGLPGLHSERMSPVFLYFVTVRGFLAQTSSQESQLAAPNGVNPACANGAHPDSKSIK